MRRIKRVQKPQSELSGDRNKGLKRVFGPPSPEVRKSIEEKQRRMEEGLPKATSGTFLSSRCNW